MAEHIVDQSQWPRADLFRFFRGYQKPHYAVTSRLDVTHLMHRKAEGVSAYRGCLYAIGAGVHAVPELCMRFRGDMVIHHDAIAISMTVPTQEGSFGYAYLPYTADFDAFDAAARAEIDDVASGRPFDPNNGGRDDLAYLSCLPWLDYTSINNALPGPDDCIPRVSWGKIVDHGDHADMAMTLEVHHALVDGAHVGQFFAAVQAALDRI